MAITSKNVCLSFFSSLFPSISVATHSSLFSCIRHISDLCLYHSTSRVATKLIALCFELIRHTSSNMLRKFLLLLSFTIHVCVVRAFGPISTTLVDRNTNFATRHHGIIHVEESSSSSSSPRCRRGFSFPLFMAKPKTTTPTTPQSDEAAAVPANLKRKVEAKRPPLGHVIPKDTREKGCE